MNTNNTNAIFDIGEPGATLRNRGLAGMGIAEGESSGIPLDQQTITALNSEAVFLTNLVRGWQGLPPLPAQQYAPTVNVGLTAEGKLLAVGAVAVIALVLIAKRR